MHVLTCPCQHVRVLTALLGRDGGGCVYFYTNPVPPVGVVTCMLYR